VIDSLAICGTFPFTKETMIRGLNADYKKISKLTIKLAKMMDKTKTIRVTTKSGTDMYGIDLTLTAASYHKGNFSGNDLSTGKKYYMVIGKNNKNLLFVKKVYNNTQEDRSNFMKNTLKNMSDDNKSIAKFIKE